MPYGMAFLRNARTVGDAGPYRLHFWDSAGSIMPFRLRILLQVFVLGTPTQPADSKAALIFFPPQVGLEVRTSKINCSVSLAVLEGCRCGQRLWSQSCCPKADRLIHLYPVLRLIPNSRHSALTVLFPDSTASTNSSLCSITVFFSHGI